MYKYAMSHDIVTKDYSDYIEIAHHKNDDESSKEPFSSKEIELLWENVHSNEYIQVILMLIYSGVRISELLELKKTLIYSSLLML